MPILHTQFPPSAIAVPGGTQKILSPAESLVQRGPCVQVSFRVADPIAAELVKQGKVVPQPVGGVALIDTGAGMTCIDDAVAQQLALPVVNVIQMASSSHTATPANVYPVGLEFVTLANDPRNDWKSAMNSELAKTISTCAIWLAVACILTFGFFKMNFDGLLGMLIVVAVPAVIGLFALEATKAVWKPAAQGKSNPGPAPTSETQVLPSAPKG